VLTLSQDFKDECEKQEAKVHDVELVIPREDTPIRFYPSEQALHFIASFIEFSIIIPWFEPIGIGRNNRRISQIDA